MRVFQQNLRISDIRRYKMLRDGRVTRLGKLRRGILVVSTGRKGPDTSSRGRLRKGLGAACDIAALHS
jgi:hypothetical protein